MFKRTVVAVIDQLSLCITAYISAITGLTITVITHSQVRYSGGMEERHVPLERMRPRALEQPVVTDSTSTRTAPHASSTSASARTIPDTKRAPSEAKAHRHQQLEASRRKGGRMKGDSGEVNGGGGQGRSSGHRVGKKGDWAAADGTEDRYWELRGFLPLLQFVTPE